MAYLSTDLLEHSNVFVLLRVLNKRRRTKLMGFQEVDKQAEVHRIAPVVSTAKLVETLTMSAHNLKSRSV